MYSSIFLLLECIVIIYIWIKHKNDFPSMSLLFLWITPFLALLSFINHNLDHDFMHPYFRMLPYILITFLLVASIKGSMLSRKTWQFWLSLISMIIYAIFSLIQVITAIYPIWSFITWLWNIPASIAFLIAGYEVDDTKLVKSNSYALWVIVGFISIGLLIRFYAIYSGSVEDLWFTRNMGSIYASGMLIFLTYGGIAWLQIKHSPKMVLMLIIFLMVSMIMAMSRSVTLPLSMMIILLLSEINRFKSAHLFKITFVILICIIASVFIITTYSENFVIAGMESGWENRMKGIDMGVANWLLSAAGRRVDEFSDIYNAVWNNHFVMGVGFGQFHYASGLVYSDAHNLFITECYENGVIATIFLYFVFIVALIYSTLNISSRRMFPIALSFIFCMILVHPAGITISSRASPSSYFTPYGLWIMLFLVGHLMRPKSLTGRKKYYLI